MNTLPLSLYVHIPWCVRKCPYCDFNSHEQHGALPEKAYLKALLDDLDCDAGYIQNRELVSVFFGGGTPSLFSPEFYQQFLTAVRSRIAFAPDIEITVEANPGTYEHGKFEEYREAGVNRLSIGVQSFNADALTQLGRIHNRNEAFRAIEAAHQAGFDNFNLDLMHGLPGQNLKLALADLHNAIDLAPTHISWYQLTIEPNTVFYRSQPTLPDEETLDTIFERGLRTLAEAGYAQYEVSAFAKAQRQAKHNLNYWQYGDYLGIGAGAHGKISMLNERGEPVITRMRKTRLPKDYLSAAPQQRTVELNQIEALDRPYEFMMNALRLKQGVPAALFSERTFLPLETIASKLSALRQRGLLLEDADRLQTTDTGFRFLNDVVMRFTD
ncbi:MAG TPA: radical SAM family heme chaperone HemW [Pseudomonadales bacterium]|nr:radical SAM family heme chaperone HemW [Pseudomonadales bacterium]